MAPGMPRQVANHADYRWPFIPSAGGHLADGATLDIAQEMNAPTMSITARVLSDEDG